MSRHADGKRHLATDCLGMTPLAMETVEAVYRSYKGHAAVEGLCLSHERLRAELEGLISVAEDSVNEIRSVLQMLDELAKLWGDEGKMRACRDRLRNLVQ